MYASFCFPLQHSELQCINNANDHWSRSPRICFILFFQWDTRVLMLVVAIYLHLYLSSTPDRWGVKSIKCALICACICTCECLHVQLKLTKWKKVIANKSVSMCAIMSVVSLFKSTFSFCAWLCVCRWGCARMSACRGENGLDFSV